MRTRNGSQVLVAGFLILTLNACTNGAGDADQAAVPQSPEEAILKLSDYHRASFDTWKGQVAKSCDAAAAFGVSQDRSTDVGIDTKALLNKNAGSLVFTNAAGSVMISSFRGFTGELRTESESTSSVNGQTTTVSAKTERSGSSCVVYLFGQKVYETNLVQNAVIGAELRSNKTVNGFISRAKIEDVGSIGSAAAREVGLVENLMEAMKPGTELRDAFAQGMGLSAQQGQQLFVLSPYPQVKFAFKLSNEISSVWNSADDRAVIASRQALQNLFGGESRRILVDLRLALPLYKFADQENSADRASFGAQAAFNLERGANGLTLRLESLELEGRKAFDAVEANSCLSGRISTYFISGQGKNELTPALSAAMEPCRILDADLETAMYTSGLMKSLLPSLFAGLSPSPQFRYGGWDQVLSRLVIETLDAGGDLRSELDPAGATQIIPVIQSSTSVIRGQLAQLKNGTALKTALDRMALSWALSGQNVDISRIGNIIFSVDIAAAPFLVSSETLLNDLGREPYSHDAELQFALGLQDSYKAESTNTLAIAKELDEKNFERDIFNRVLQTRPALGDIQIYGRLLATVRSELAKYPNLAPVKSQMSTLATSWMKSGGFTTSEIPFVYEAISNVIDAFPVSTREMIQTLGLDDRQNRELINYAGTLSPVFKAQALKIAADSSAAGYSSWGNDFINTVLQRRPSPAQVSAWSSLWSGVTAFVQRELQRIGGESAMGAEWRRKSLIDKAVKEGWTEVEFQGLETIAALAVFKTSCERHKDISSLADCAGSSLFSKDARKFFDPAFQNRYTGLAHDLRGHLSQMGDFNWVSIKGLLVREFFGSFETMWSRCDGTTFNQRAAELNAVLNQALVETDSFKRFDQERRIRDLVRNCN